MRARSATAVLIVPISILLASSPASASAVDSTRAALVLPDTLWQHVLAGAGVAGPTLGYGAEERAHYGRDMFLLRPVANLFSDVRAIPRRSGQLATELVAQAGSAADLVRTAFLLTDVSAGRNLPLADSTTAAGAPWSPDSLDAAAAATWRTLPLPAQRLVLQLLAGAAEAAPWLRAAYDEPFLAAAAGERAPLDSLYALAAAPWTEDRLGQLATLRRASFAAPRHLDREYLAFGSILFLAHVDRALAEYGTAGVAPPRVDLRFPTALGEVVIRGAGDDVHAQPAFLTVDLAGNDEYRGRHAVPAGPDRPLALVLDLAGADRYAGGDPACAMACGLFGLGALIDLAGNDAYRVAESGLGAAWYGTGLLLDAAGDDEYVVDRGWGEGAAHVGVGLLVDRAGDDAYTCAEQSQGLGSTLGAGILVDATGNDRYLARDDGNPSDLYNGLSVAMAQGVGYGRRADLGDGHSLAGGFGVLVDGAGDDSYHATCWSQGAGYWWGVGLLEDLGGDDTYRNGKYSLGAAAHFAIGCQVDLSGRDRYNIGNTIAVNQFQGHARDGSIGISIDGGGDDEHLLRSHCGGSADLASIGLFWNRAGNDLYDVRFEPLGDNPDWSDTPPLGTTTVYPPAHSFRDDLEAVGLFLDTGGRDEYRWQDLGPAASAASAAATAPPAGDNREWPSRRGPRAHGCGLDGEWVARQ